MLDPSAIIKLTRNLKAKLQEYKKHKAELDRLQAQYSTIEADLNKAIAKEQRFADAVRKSEDRISELQNQRNALDIKLSRLDKARDSIGKKMQRQIKNARKAGDTIRADSLEKGLQTFRAGMSSKAANIRVEQKTIDDSLSNQQFRLDGINAGLLNQREITRTIGEELRDNKKSQKDVAEDMNAASKAAGRMADSLGLSGTHLKNMLNASSLLKGVMGGLITTAVKQVGDVYKTFRDAGQSATQTFENMGKIIGVVSDGLSEGVIAAPAAFAKNMAAIQNSLGTMEVDSGLTVQATQMTEYYGLAPDQAATLTSQLQRQNKFQSEITANQLQSVESLARIRNIAPGTLYADIAKNTRYMAQYAHQGLEAFAKSAIELRKMGVEQSAMEGMADNLVNDFEGILRLEQKLKAYMPGFDISNIVNLAQNGATPNEIANALGEEFRRNGVMNVPNDGRFGRSIQNEIAGGFGIDKTTLANAITGINPNDKDNPNVISTPASGMVNAIGDVAVPALDKLATAAIAAATALNMMSLSSVANSITNLGKSKGLIGNLTKGGGSIVNKAAAAVLPRRGAAAVRLFTGRASKVAGGFIGKASGIGNLALGAYEGYEEYKKSKEQGDSAGKSLLKASAKSAGSIAGGVAGASLGAALSAFAGPAAPAVAAIAIPLGSAAGSYFGGKISDAVIGLFNDTKKTALQNEKDIQKKKLELLDEEKKAKDLARAERMAGTFNRFFVSVDPTTPKPAANDSIRSVNQSNYGQSKIGNPLVTGQKKHSGGIVGKGPTISIPRFHNGYMPDEVPAILQRGEAVLSRSQLQGLTNLMNVASSMGRVGESFKNVGSATESLNKMASGNSGFSRFISSVSGFATSVNNANSKKSFVAKDSGAGVVSRMTGVSKDTIANFLAKSDKGSIVKNNAIGAISRATGINQTALQSIANSNNPADVVKNKLRATATNKAVQFLASKGGNEQGIRNVLNRSNPQAALKQKATGYALDKATNKFGQGKVNTAMTLLKGGDVKGNVKSLATNKLVGMATSKFMGSQIGAALGSVVPGAGTIVGSLVGMGVGKLMDSKAAKKVGQFIGKSPVGVVGKKVMGAVGNTYKSIGNKIGGLFGKKKKSAKPVAAQQESIDIPDNQAVSYMTAQQALTGKNSASSTDGKQVGPVSVDMKPLEDKLSQLINLMQNGGIAVNLDGKKVSNGLMDAFSRG